MKKTLFICFIVGIICCASVSAINFKFWERNKEEPQAQSVPLFAVKEAEDTDKTVKDWFDPANAEIKKVRETAVFKKYAENFEGKTLCVITEDQQIAVGLDSDGLFESDRKCQYKVHTSEKFLVTVQNRLENGEAISKEEFKENVKTGVILKTKLFVIQGRDKIKGWFD